MARRTVTEQLQLLYDHAAAAETLEHEAAAAATLDLRNRVEAVSRWLAARWVAEFGTLTADADPGRLHLLLAELRQRIAGIHLDPSRIVLLWAARALTLGVTQAGNEIGVSVPLAATVSVESAAAAAKTARRVTDRLQRAQRLLTVVRGSKHDDVVPGLAAAHAAVADVERATRWVVNREVNNGSHQVADVLFADLMWVAERDACVHCLAYSGVVAPHGHPFPPDLTFGAKPLTPWPDGILERPPLHMNCRCRITPWIGHDTEGARTASIPGWHKGQASANVSLSDALKREARRSVLKGWSLPSESNYVRLQAADRLLQRGANLPKTVEAQARRAIKTGHFQSRTVPGG